MQKLSYVLAVVLLASSSVAFRTFPYFAPTARVQTLVTTNAKHCASTEMKSNAAAAIVATVLGINLLTGNVVSAVSFESSSIMISDQIKTFDMSLPSYDKISDARASLAAVEDREAKTSQKTTKVETEGSSPQSGSVLGVMSGSSGSSPFAVKKMSKAERNAAREAKQAALAEEMAKREAVLNQKLDF